MKKSISVLDFQAELEVKDIATGRLFLFLDKFLTADKCEDKWVLRRKKQGLVECRTRIRHYNLDKALPFIDNLIANHHPAQHKSVPKWQAHKELILSKL